MSTLLFWNKQNGEQKNGETKNGKKNWLHTPDVLVNGHVAYPVKFLGSTPVDQPKGIEVVKEAIRRLEFSQQIKKAESGSNHKSQKVEITVSINGVAIQKQENKTQVILNQFPLHKISYCADEQGTKKYFSFIAKTGLNNNNSTTSSNGSTISNGTNDSMNSADGETHECFVFVASKLASDITLTIGQAFDIAYRRYINESGKTGGSMGTGDVSKLQSQNKYLETSVASYRARLVALADYVSKTDLERVLTKFGVRNITELPPQPQIPAAQTNGTEEHVGTMNGKMMPELGMDTMSSNDDQLLIETSNKQNNNNNFAVPSVPPRNFQAQLNNTLEALKPSVGTKLEGLLINSDSDDDFDPRACESEIITNGNGVNGGGPGANNMNDLFGFEPPKSMGQQLFTGAPNGMPPTNGMNGNNVIISNGGSNHPSSPPPLLAPPPKAATPRRGQQSPNKASQDLFGLSPFSPFDADESSSTGTITNAKSDLDLAFNSLPQTQNLTHQHQQQQQPNPFNTQSMMMAAPAATSFNSMHPFIPSVAATTTNSGFQVTSPFGTPPQQIPSMTITHPQTDSNLNHSVFGEITTLSYNFQKLDSIVEKSNFPQPVIDTTDLNGFHQATSPLLVNGDRTTGASTQSTAKKLNPFSKITNNRSKSPTLNDMKKEIPPEKQTTSPSKSKPNPFSRSESFLNRNMKYDAFKNAIEYDGVNGNTTTGGYGDNSRIINGGVGGNVGSFGDGFGMNSGTDTKRAHNFNEFSNRLIESTYTFGNSGNGGRADF